MRSAKSVGLAVLGALLFGAVAHAAGIAWLDVYSTDGKRAWQVPEGWKVEDGVDEDNSDYLVYDAPDADGKYAIASYNKDEGTCPRFVNAATKGAKAKAVKGILCAEGKDGEQVLAACAREDKKGYILVSTLRVTPELYKKLGGLAALRTVNGKTYGILPVR